VSYSEKVKQLGEASMTQTPMPRYQCHKKVWALKIASVEIVRPTIEELQSILDGKGTIEVGAIITPADHGYGPFGVSSDYVSKHDPQPGGYYVVYDDGYKSFSPATAFEEGYTLIGAVSQL
jgi:hypothetical protein